MINAIPKPVRHVEKKYREWIKSLPCLVLLRPVDCPIDGPCLCDCEGEMDPHHVIPDGGGKAGSKVSDRRCVPLCRKHHDAAGRREWFEDTLCIDFEANIQRLNREYDRVYPKVRKPRERKSPDRLQIVHSVCGKVHQVRHGMFRCRGKQIQI